MTPRRRMINLVAIAVLAAATGLVTNYASEDVPEWFKDDPVRIWLTFALVVVVAVLVQVVASREKPEPESFAPVPPRFPAVPSTLRRPTLDTPVVRGRDQELAEILHLVSAPKGRFVVVCGPGGTGKTTLAIQVADEASRQGFSVFWIRWRGEELPTGHSGEELLAAQMVQVAVTLGLPETRVGAVQQAGGSLVDLVWGHLEQVAGWVLVVDNADRTRALGLDAPVAEHRGWIRPDGAGLLVITSRDRAPGTWGRGAHLMRLAPLSPDEGAQVLMDQAPDGGTREAAVRLALRLGGLPLALHAAGTAVAQPTARLRLFDTYRAALDDGTSTVIAPDVTDPEVARSLVGHTWELSLDQLTAEGLPTARPLLRALALLADAPIPRSLVGPGLLPATMERILPAEVDSALAGLERYGLIDVAASGAELTSVVLHPLVREASRLLAHQAAETSACYAALEKHLIEFAISCTTQGRAVWPVTRLLAPHLLVLPGLTTDTEFATVRDAIDHVADQLDQAGQPAVAITLRQHVLAAELDRLGANHPDTLASQTILAAVLDSLGRSDEAEQLLRRTLDQFISTLGPDHPHTLVSQSTLAAVLDSLGRYDEAEQLHRRTLDTTIAALGDDHPDTLATQSNLALVLHNLGRYDEAEQLLRRVLNATIASLGPDHPDTLNSQTNLASALDSLGRSSEAEQLHRRTLDELIATLGPDHPNTLKSQNNLAGVLDSLGRYDEAEQLLRRTLEQRISILGPDHPDTLNSQNNLAAVLDNLGRYDEAEQLHRRVFHSAIANFGPDHPNTLTSQSNLARVLDSLGRYDEAEQLHRRTLEQRISILGPDHPDTLTSQNNLMSFLQRQEHKSRWWTWLVRRHRGS